MFLEEYHLGQKFFSPPVEMDREELLAFSRRYDNLPLHTDEEYAKKTRFGGLIAPGMLSFLAVWSRFLEMGLYGEELVAGTGSDTRWLAPVYPGDRLTGELTVTGITPRNPRNGVLETTLEVKNQDGTPVLTNVTRAVVERRSSEDPL